MKGYHLLRTSVCLISSSQNRCKVGIIIPTIQTRTVAQKVSPGNSAGKTWSMDSTGCRSAFQADCSFQGSLLPNPGGVERWVSAVTQDSHAASSVGECNFHAGRALICLVDLYFPSTRAVLDALKTRDQ